MTRLARWTVVFTAVLVALAGCQRQLIDTPNLYIGAENDPFDTVPPELRTTTVDLLYVTDRKREEDQGEPVRYGFRRSRSLAFGSIVVEIGKDLTWETLVEQSRLRKRTVSLPLDVVSTTEIARFHDSPAPIIIEDGVVKPDPEYVDDQYDVLDELYDEVRRRLALTWRKEAYIFIHGFANTLDDATYRMAELWHFLGREGVPIVYSWPAGAPGMIRGYNRDRESGEFTAFHLKEFLRLLAQCPELEKINLIAHSRGTDITMTAIRELIIVSRAKGEDPKATLKFDNIVIAAPDVSEDVASQRFAAERLYDGFDLMTVYVTKNDRALGSAEWLFATGDRIGKLRVEDLDAEEVARLRNIPNSDIVDARIKTDYLGHAYFLSDPATCSDLILVLRYGKPPGAANGRPLTEIAPAYYILDKNYPMKAAPLPKPRRSSPPR